MNIETEEFSDADQDGIKITSQVISARTGLNSRAYRLAGVTRNRSVSPSRSSKIVEYPSPIPLPKARKARMPGKKTSSTLLVGNPGPPASFCSKGVNKARYSSGVERPTATQTRIAQSLNKAALKKYLEIQLIISFGSSMFFTGAVSRSDRPVFCRKTSSSVGSDREMVLMGYFLYPAGGSGPAGLRPLL